MAITTNIRINKNANAGIPSTYTPATLPTITSKVQDKSTTDILASLIENATVATALTNVGTELQTFLTGYYNTDLHLDAADTFTVNVTVTKIERIRLESNDLKPGADYYKIYFSYEYN
jgi:hypothetical protein